MAEVSFGEWLKRRRGAEGWTQKQLAQQINCSISSLRKMEAEERRPSVEVIERLSEIFNIPQEEHKAFLRFTRGDWQAISSATQDEAPWRLAPVPAETQIATVTARHNLPLQLTSFIGREREQTEIVDLLTKHRLVTLIGAGGIGKTRLSLEVAQGVLNTFPDGLWFIELAPLSDPALVPQIVVNTLGLIEQANRSPQMVVTDFLKAKKSLLILDNCEHLIQPCAQLAEVLLHACPHLKVLVTSREALGVPGEFIHNVAALSIPDIKQTIRIQSLTEYESVQLLLERAQTATRDFLLTEENGLAIAKICQHLDGIPLALELAAARLRGLSIEQVASRLNDRFRLLTSGARTVLPRHQTLQALIDWSHDLLTAPERILFRRLVIFAGGWTLEAAEQVCAGEGLEVHQILDLLLRLVDKSLVVVDTQGVETRYRMLETIRQYAREKLWAAGEGDMMRQRHVPYFLDLAERAEPNLRAFDMVLWLDRLEVELDNIRGALEYALETDIEAQLRIASALMWFWWLRYHRSEGFDWLERGLSVETEERGDQLMTTSRAMIRGKALNVGGFLILWMFDYRKAEARLEESLALFRNLGDAGKRGVAYALLQLAHLPSKGNQGRDSAGQSLTIFRELHDKFGIAECLAFLFDEPKTAERLALSREIGDQDGIAGALWGLASFAFAQDDYQRAIALYEESLAGFRMVGNKGMAGVLLSELGKTALVSGDYRLAAQRLTEALATLQYFGMKEAIAITLRRLGRLDWAKGDYGQAAQHYEESLKLFRETESWDGMVSVLYSLGKVSWAQGYYEQAGKRYEEILIKGQETNNSFTIAYALYGLGEIAVAKADYVAARLSHVQALRIRQETGDQRNIACSLIVLAALAVRRQKAMLACRLFGATEDVEKLIHFIMSPRERAEHDQAIAAARAALGEEAFATAYEEGKKMTLDEAVAYALGDAEANVG